MGIGFIIVVLTGHLLNQFALHISSIVFVLIVSYVLFRQGSIGGADAKSLLLIAITSPGVELGDWGNPLFEGIIAGGLEMFVMLLLGTLYWRTKASQSEEDTQIPPLIPFLLIGYLVIQLLAFV